MRSRNHNGWTHNMKKQRINQRRLTWMIGGVLFLLFAGFLSYPDISAEETEEYCPYCEKANEYRQIYAAHAVAAQPVKAVEHPILYLFWADGCPHCAEEKEFLDVLRQQYPQLEMRFFEVWNHPEFAELGEALAQAYQIQAVSVPLTFLGDWAHIGFRSWEETGLEIDAQVQRCLQDGCIDALEKVVSLETAVRIRREAANQSPTDWQLSLPSAAPEQPAPDPTPAPAVTPQPFRFESAAEAAPAATPKPFQLAPVPSSAPDVVPHADPPDPNAITVPLIGTLTVSQVGLPLFTIFIGGLDGFNPCAMWVLCFLLSLVIYAKSRA